LMGGVVVRVEYALRVTHVLWGDMWLRSFPWDTGVKGTLGIYGGRGSWASV